jgi:hypothetical protein
MFRLFENRTEDDKPDVHYMRSAIKTACGMYFIAGFGVHVTIYKHKVTCPACIANMDDFDYDPAVAA